VQTKTQSRKRDRRLKNIHFCLERVIQQAAQQELTPGNQQSLRPLLEDDSGIESSVFDASNLANLLKGSRSVLCLSLPHIPDSNVDAMWVPEAKESIPLKSTTVEIRPGFPRMSSQFRVFKSTESTASPSSPDRMLTVGRVNTRRRVLKLTADIGTAVLSIASQVSSHLPDGLLKIINNFR